MKFQDIIMTLHEYWAKQGCIIWQPHNEKVGAGTANPATVLRVLGPEPFKVGYLEPSARPADGRYGENPNRFYEYYQYQVILKPAPVNNIELYLNSLDELGLDWKRHDIRFVEDNWQSPSLGAWGLGWEVWLDGLEITQYTYFQQAATIDLNPVCIEITYGLERIAMYLQGVNSIPEIVWRDNLTYGELHLNDEIDYCKYNFDHANVSRLRKMYELFEAEAEVAIGAHLVLPAHDYLLRCSHTFNVLDARGAIGVTQRAEYFSRMRNLARKVADIYLSQREETGFAFSKHLQQEIQEVQANSDLQIGDAPTNTDDFLLEIGTEELPASDVKLALEQLEAIVPEVLTKSGLDYQGLDIFGTPQRLTVYIRTLAATQKRQERVVRGPSTQVAFDSQGDPTEAALGFARSVGLAVNQLDVEVLDGKQYVVARIETSGEKTIEILRTIVPTIIQHLKFPLVMRWNDSQVAFARPIRWLVTLYGSALVKTEYAGVRSDIFSRSLRSSGSNSIPIPAAKSYFDIMEDAQVVIRPEERRLTIIEQMNNVASVVSGTVALDHELLEEVVNLVECPRAILGKFDKEFLNLPKEVIVTVMKKHQRYFPVVKDGELLPYFITIGNTNAKGIDTIRTGNESVIRARFSDAKFFYDLDTHQALSEFVPQLSGLSFQDRLGSYLEKANRLKILMPIIAETVGYEGLQEQCQELSILLKADLVTNLVVEFTSLQGVIGRHYALLSGFDTQIADAINQHYMPRFSGDNLPSSRLGIVAALSDRLDTLVGLFSLGLEPTAGSDPHGLRRTAFAIIQILVEHKLSVSLRHMIEACARQITVEPRKDELERVHDFLVKRLQSWLTDQGFRQAHIDAVITVNSDNPARSYNLLVQLEELSKRDEFSSILQAFSRVVNITHNRDVNGNLNVEFLEDPTAHKLYEIYARVMDSLDVENELESIFDGLSMLVEPIDKFFEHVLVMHEDEKVRHARLSLLQRIVQLPCHVLDLTKITIQ